MEVAVAAPCPVDELNAELEGRLRAADEVVLIDTEHLIEQANRRNRRLADAHRADLRGFDQRDRAERARQRVRQGGRRHPAGSAAADYCDGADAAIVHRITSAAAPRNAAR